MKPRPGVPHSRLVPHDIQVARLKHDGGDGAVVATVHCERRGCRERVEACARCERFARIEPHEAGYVLLCRPTDSAPPSPDDLGAGPQDNTDEAD